VCATRGAAERLDQLVGENFHNHPFISSQIMKSRWSVVVIFYASDKADEKAYLKSMI
jgi:hypothetical protein